MLSGICVSASLSSSVCSTFLVFLQVWDVYPYLPNVSLCYCVWTNIYVVLGRPVHGHGWSEDVLESQFYVLSDNHWYALWWLTSMTTVSLFVAITRPALHREGPWHWPAHQAAAAQQLRSLSNLHLQVSLMITVYAFFKLSTALFVHTYQGALYCSVLISKGTTSSTATGTMPTSTSMSRTVDASTYVCACTRSQPFTT